MPAAPIRPTHEPPPLPRPSALPDRYLTPDDLASILDVPLETVYGWRRKRTGPPGFRVGKHLRYDPAAVHNWVTQQMAHDAA